MIEWLSSLSAITSPVILTIIIAGVIAMYRTGTLQYLLSKNGNGNKEMGELKEQITMLKNNHLHELAEKLDDIKDELKEHTKKFDEHFKIETENQYLLKSLIEKNDRRN